MAKPKTKSTPKRNYSKRKPTDQKLFEQGGQDLLDAVNRVASQGKKRGEAYERGVSRALNHVARAVAFGELLKAKTALIATTSG